jgi:transcriptional regulator GlxA family with amidase domain
LRERTERAPGLRREQARAILGGSVVGRRIARDIAKRMVMYHRRSGGFPQVSTMLQLEPRSDRIQKVLAYAEENLRAPLTIEALARVANLSPRQFTRAFRSETGESPARAIEMLRLEAARVMMEQGRHPMKFIAWQTGFVDRERMRRAFRRAFGQPPRAVSRTARNGVATQTRTPVPRWNGDSLIGLL